MTDLLEQPHHDGSPVHVGTDRPALGDTVEVFVRVPHTYDLQGVHLRSVHDGEPRWAAAEIAQQDKHDTWWRADLLIGNPVTSYRFLLDRGPKGYAWLTGTGPHAREVGDAADFRITVYPQAPTWVTDATIYQVFLDRFASADSSGDLPDWAVPAAWHEPVVDRGDDTPHQFYGGDLRGVEQRLDHLIELGATMLYLTPFFPAASNHRYNAATFEHVDPLLGGDEALVSLVGAAHARGLKVIGDLTTNHTGSTHEWFQTAQRDPTSPEAGFYTFTRHPDRYACWLDVPTLPKLDLTSPELRRRLIAGPDSIVARYLKAPFHLDGWRIDVANMTGRQGATDVNAEVAATIRRTMDAVAQDRYLLAEHFHDPSLDLRRDGWHGVMNYLGFLRPLWSWLGQDADRFPFLGMPVGIPSIGGGSAVTTMRESSAQMPWSAFTASTILLGSHDTPRVRTIVGSSDRHHVAAGILATYPGVPLVFMGDEFGVEGIDGEDGRVPMPWDAPHRIDRRTWETYRDLLALRARHPALRRGGLRWAHADEDSIAYLRETRDERLLVLAARDGDVEAKLPGTICEGPPDRRYGAGRLGHEGEHLVARLQGPGIGVWALP